MAKSVKVDKQPTAKEYKEKVGINGSFLDVFKVVKKDKERRAKEENKKP